MKSLNTLILIVLLYTVAMPAFSTEVITVTCDSSCQTSGNGGEINWAMLGEEGRSGSESTGRSSSGGDRGDYRERIIQCLNAAQDRKFDCYNTVNDTVSLFTNTCNAMASATGMITAEVSLNLGAGIVVFLAYGAYCQVVSDIINNDGQSSCDKEYLANKSAC